MYEKDHNITVDPSPYSPHSIIPNLIRQGSSVLDIGCASGGLGKALKKKNCTCYGIEINRQMARGASRYYKKILIKNIEDTMSVSMFGNVRFDYIVFGDILEHTARPDQILLFFNMLLKRDGIVIISLPNIARFEIRLQLLFGKFNYTKSGIVHQDHLRHFTLATGRELIEQSGLSVKRIVPSGLGARIRVFPTLTAYQFIYVCRKV